MRSRIVLALLFVPTLARGQGDGASAEQLFREGRELMAAKNYALACPKLEASQRLDPGAGTLLNLARCYEVAGRTASAWVTYRDAESAAEQSNRTSWAESAHAHAEALAPQLVYFTVTVSEAREGLVVARDGRVVDPSIYGVAVPVDPGPHTFIASAPGHETWTSTVEVPPRTSLAVPPLPPMQRPRPPASAPSAALARPSASGHAQRTVGVVAGATGLAAVAVGTIFGLDARSTYDDAIAGDCRGDPRACSKAGVDRVGTARRRATTSTALFIAGRVPRRGRRGTVPHSAEATCRRGGRRLSPPPGGMLLMRRLVFLAAVLGPCAAACASILGFDAVSLAPGADAAPDAAIEPPDANFDGSSAVGPTQACGAPLGTTDNCAACGHSCLRAACVDGGCETIPLLSAAVNPAALVLDERAAYIATFDDVVRIDKETNASFDVLRGGSGGAFIESLAVDATLVYWGARQANTFACPKTGCSDAGRSRQGPAATNPIAIALAGDDLVWNDGIAARLYAVDLRTGQDVRALSPTLVRSRTLATDGTAIYVPNGDDQAILRITLDGGSTTTLAHTTGSATALTLVGATVFFGASDGSLGTVSTDGGGAAAFAARTTSVASLASDGNHLYWADRGTTAAGGQRQSDGCIYRCTLATCTVAKPTAVRCGLSTPNRIAVDGSAIYWTSLGPGMENDIPISGSVAKMAKPPP